jgi:chromosome segregation ATPase
MTQKIEDTIAGLAKRGEQLAVKRAKAQDALDKTTKARQDTLLSGDLDDQRAIDKLQSAVDSAASALVGIDDAISILARQKSEAEPALAEQRERVARTAAADKLTVRVTAIETAFKPWLEQSRIFADALSELAHVHFGADEMSKFLENCMGQLETAMNFQITELKTMPAAILDGRQPIPADKPKPVPVAMVPPTATSD